MSGLLWAVFVASLLGSVHCAGMCGGIAAFVGGSGAGAMQWRVHLLYHLGRLVSYTAAGALAGGLGAALDLGGEAAGLGRLGITLAGAVMITYGLFLLARLRGIRASVPVPAPLRSGYRRAFAAMGRRGPYLRAAALGLLTALLPCGWLYMYAVTAAATGSPALGALLMGAFWLGTVPLLALVGVGARHLLGPLERYAPTFSALLLVGVGLLMLARRLDVPPFAATGSRGDPPACHAPAPVTE